MPDPLKTALGEALLIGRDRGWTPPDIETLGEAQRLIALVDAQRLTALVAGDARAPEVLVAPDGAVALEWDVPGRGWLQLAVHGRGTLSHSAVIDGDEYEQAEAFGPELPAWAQELLSRLRPKGLG
ncbi:hypothetical protein [Aquabacterium sp.]|uniref:hypothetical protein n=1 Tax=Aquabacterium sp. TaxID=1872578 RepID=UPI002D19AE0A|nr:hypothetical protein [Aquabacterium sp.]HSW06866.1 hypothetical protein [Aquabacterium sp.]